MESIEESGNTQRRGARHRIAAKDFAIMEEVLISAMFLMFPEGISQKRAFSEVMPTLFALRQRGATWPQLTASLNKCGFKLQSSTVRNYYCEMQSEQINAYAETMNEQSLLIEQLDKQISLSWSPLLPDASLP